MLSALRCPQRPALTKMRSNYTLSDTATVAVVRSALKALAGDLSRGAAFNYSAVIAHLLFKAFFCEISSLQSKRLITLAV